MYCVLYFLLFIVSYPTEIDQAFLRPFGSIDNYRNAIFTENLLNETHFTWILYPPWKRYSDLFNDKPNNHSVEYFGIIGENHITNESFLETSKLPVYKNVNLTFYSKVHYSPNTINLILFTYQCNTWNKVWEYTQNHSQWEFHQLSINITDENEDIRLRFLPISTSSDQIFIAIAIANITTHINWDKFNQTTSLQNATHRRNYYPIHLILLILFGSAFLFLFIAVMAVFIYGLINKQYSRWFRKRSSRRRRKGRKTRNVVRDESTVLGVESNTV